MVRRREFENSCENPNSGIREVSNSWNREFLLEFWPERSILAFGEVGEGAGEVAGKMDL